MSEYDQSTVEFRISPLIRGFMHVALLRRLSMMPNEAERTNAIEEFLAIRTEDEARAYIRSVRIEARVDDLRDMAARRLRKRRRDDGKTRE